MPCSGPRELPCVISASARRAAAMATSGVRVMKALSWGSSASVRASRLSVYSTGDSLRTASKRAASANVRSCSSADGMAQLRIKMMRLSWRTRIQRAAGLAQILEQREYLAGDAFDLTVALFIRADEI